MMKRGRGGAKRMDLSDMRELFADGKMHGQLGIVVQPEGVGSHWEREEGTGDILVEVEIASRGIIMLCRLGCGAGTGGYGAWRVPAVGTEVAIIVTDGDETFDPMIVACLSSGGAPARVGIDKTLFTAPDALEFDAPAIRVGGEHATEAAIKGDARKTDETTALTAIAAALTEIAAGLTALSQSSGATTAGATAVNLFKSQLAGHLSSVVKVR